MLEVTLLVLLLNLALTQGTGIECANSDRIRLAPTLSNQCSNTLQPLCIGVAVSEHLVDMHMAVTISCPLSQSSGINFTQSDGVTELSTITNGGRFSISGTTLTISDLRPEDEGLYRCSNGQQQSGTVKCLIVSGLARFRTCDSVFRFAYTRSPTTENSCSQEKNVTEGENAIFDTRLSYNGSGTCQCIEEVTLFRIYKDTVGSPPIYSCNEIVNNCQNNSIFVVERESEGIPYNFFLVLSSVRLSDSGTYYVRIEVKEPGITAHREFWKNFQLTVSPAPITTMATTMANPTTVNQDDTSFTGEPATLPTRSPATLSSTSGMNTIPLGNSNQVSRIAGSVIGVVLFMLLILAALLLIIRVLIYKNRRIHYKGNFYREVVAGTTVSLGRKQDGRSSVCVNVTLELPSQLESEEQVDT